MKVQTFGTKEAEGDLDGLLVAVGVTERVTDGEALGVGEGLLVVPHAAEDSILLQ